MTVKELIKELEKHPPNALVAWSDHDNLDGELNNHVRCVLEFDPETAFDKQFAKGVKVVLRP